VRGCETGAGTGLGYWGAVEQVHPVGCEVPAGSRGGLEVLAFGVAREETNCPLAPLLLRFWLHLSDYNKDANNSER
jgi:hypothetical protein